MTRKALSKKVITRPWLAVTVFAIGLIMFTGSLLLASFVVSRDKPGTSRASGSSVAWPIFDGGGADPGANYSESVITTSNASQLAKLWEATLPAAADNAIVEQPFVSTSQGVVNVIFVNTIKGNLVAYNAGTGSKIWEADPSTANWNGQGTKSAPAIDPSGNYIYAYAIDGYVHKYAIGTGTEVTGTGFPAQITLLPNNVEKGSASINIAGGYLYMTTSGNDGDYGHYVGHVVAVNLSSGAKTVWNSECSNIAQLLTTSGGNYCSDTQSGIWARPGVKVDPVTGNVFVATGNGKYNANSGGYDWGDSIIELKPNLSQIVDSYTPATYNSLQSGDADLGSTAPVILPTQGGSNTPYMIVQAGKDHIIRLLNRSNLSGQGGPGHTGGEMQTITISDEVHEEPAVWTDSGGATWVFVTDESGDLYAYKVVTTSGASSLVQQYHKSLGVSSSPFVANGVLYLDGPNILALNAATGATLFNSSTVGVSLNQHWESPVVVNGLLFTPDYNGNLFALYVPGASVTNPSPPPTPPAIGGSQPVQKVNPSNPTPKPAVPGVNTAPTAPTSPTAPPSSSGITISAIKVASVTSSSATVTWTTSLPATSEIYYGVTSKYGLSAAGITAETAHSQLLNSASILARTTYHFKIAVSGPSGSYAVSADETFVTQGASLLLTIYGANGKFIPGAVVTYGNETVTTNSLGQATLTNLPAGMVKLNVNVGGKVTPETVDIAPANKAPVQAKFKVLAAQTGIALSALLVILAVAVAGGALFWWKLRLLNQSSIVGGPSTGPPVTPELVMPGTPIPGAPEDRTPPH